MVDDNYPGISDRVKAVVTDSVIMVMFMMIMASIFGHFENAPDYVRITVLIFIFVLYDPIFTSSFGGTIGHMIFGIRVKREKNQHQNILFPLALIRYIVKALLGWISLLTVSGSKKRKAIHDLIAGSVVVYKK